jgi:hypothetical protein
MKLFKEFNLECECGCETIRFIDYEDEDLGIEFMVSSFYAKQEGIFWIIWHRLKAAWFMLSGKEFLLHDIILNKQELTNFKSFVSKL